jgi:hypothetical protein
MKSAIPLLALLLACASRQSPPGETGPVWKPVEVAELRGECIASYIDRGVEPPKAKALCGCAVPRLTEMFSYSWFNDGQRMTPDELQAMSSVYLSCAKDVLQSDSSSARGSGALPGPDRQAAQFEL